MTRLSIPEMSCGHCKAAVLSALNAVPGVAAVSVDLEHRTAAIEGSAALPDLLTALDAAGYAANVA
jgi:copper chaperone